MVIDRGFWRGKTVFVTGHTGFKGGWLSLWLGELGARVIGYSLKPETGPNLHGAAKVAAELAGETIGDIRDGERLTSCLRAARPDIVIHMAARSLVLRSYDDPVETFSSNVVGTVALLHAIRAVESVRAVVVVTSDKCYENRESIDGYHEADRLGGHDPYSASKAATELAVAAMRASYFSALESGGHPAAIASARAGNVIGGGDWAADRLVPDMLRALANGVACPIRHPGAIRPWQHVMEPLSGYLCLAQALWRDGEDHAGAWNFGPAASDARPVSWISERIADLWQPKSGWPGRAGPAGLAPRMETSRLSLDSSKARLRLGWEPVWSLDTALRSVVDWHRAWLRGGDMRAQTILQIHQYHDDSDRLRRARPWQGASERIQLLEDV